MNHFLNAALDPTPSPAAPADTIRLSRRQREVLGLLAEGLPARVIATRLGITETTARNHIHRLLQRLGCHSQLQAVARARRWHLI
jgi:two-component system nitrate/nitrite response regulator NarL